MNECIDAFHCVCAFTFIDESQGRVKYIQKVKFIFFESNNLEQFHYKIYEI